LALPLRWCGVPSHFGSHGNSIATREREIECRLTCDTPDPLWTRLIAKSILFDLLADTWVKQKPARQIRGEPTDGVSDHRLPAQQTVLMLGYVLLKFLRQAEKQ
jgi:hypothetical protein